MHVELEARAGRFSAHVLTAVAAMSYFLSLLVCMFTAFSQSVRIIEER